MSGWIKLRRSLTDWQWYSDHNATRLLIHLLLTVNYKDKKWRGITIYAGSMVLSWGTLSESVGLSIQQARTAMAKLIDSGEVTRKVTNKYQVITLVKWEKMQIEDITTNNQTNRQITNKQQTNNNQLTTTKESKEYKERKEKYSESDFLNDWNELRFKHLKKPSHLNRVGGMEAKQNFRDLSKDYKREDFKNALIGLFKQKKMPNDNTTMQSNPAHFLKFFNSYLTAYHDQNVMLYGKEKV